MNLIELVPRDLNQLITDGEKLLDKYPMVKGINIPDIKRLNHRSYEAVKPLLKNNIVAIPHIRAMDLPIQETVEIIVTLVKEYGLTHVLIITGDLPEDGKKVERVTPIEITQEIKRQVPTLEVYGALDPYRQEKDLELGYVRRKIESGMTGVFTQPFFDCDYLVEYLEELKEISVFVGISPVTNERSYLYWERTNKVKFPDDFSLDFKKNCQLASQIIKISEQYSQHTYLMPIKEDPYEYLKIIKDYM